MGNRVGSEYCGRNYGLVTAFQASTPIANVNAANIKTVCSECKNVVIFIFSHHVSSAILVPTGTLQPFLLRFLSDTREVAPEGANRGFRLTYIQVGGKFAN